MHDSTAARSISIRPRSKATRVRGVARRIGDVDEPTRTAMFALFETYFEGATRGQFDADLRDKSWAIILEDGDNGRLCGFSTLATFEATVDGERVVAVVSGDTIVDRDYWGETQLARVWSRKAFELADALAPRRVFWLLICSGYKTYRFLPVFYREFFPRHDIATPRCVARLMEALASARYGSAYDPATGIVRFAQPSRLRDGVAAVTDDRMKDPHVAFFQSANPGHECGDELVCITELTPGNLTAAGRRMLYGRS